jgi:hypothetical protein
LEVWSLTEEKKRRPQLQGPYVEKHTQKGLDQSSVHVSCDNRVTLRSRECSLTSSTIKNVHVGAYHEQATCVQSLHMSELRCVLPSGQSRSRPGDK